jgi:hypothetical protein
MVKSADSVTDREAKSQSYGYFVVPMQPVTFSAMSCKSSRWISHSTRIVPDGNGARRSNRDDISSLQRRECNCVPETRGPYSRWRGASAQLTNTTRELHRLFRASLPYPLPVSCHEEERTRVQLVAVEPAVGRRSFKCQIDFPAQSQLRLIELELE